MIIIKNTYLKRLKRLSAGLSAMLTIREPSAAQAQLPDSIYHDTVVNSNNLLGLCICVNRDKYLSPEHDDTLLTVDSGEHGTYLL